MLCNSPYTSAAVRYVLSDSHEWNCVMLELDAVLLVGPLPVRLMLIFPSSADSRSPGLRMQLSITTLN